MKTIQEMFEEYLVRTYPTTVLTHEELVRLKHGFFGGFTQCYQTDDLLHYTDQYEWEINEFFRDHAEEKR